VGRWGDVVSTTGAVTHDLGEVVLLPGLVNAHCHLDYTGLAGQLPPTASFTDWVKSITALKEDWSLDGFRASWRAGAQMLLRHGTTTVADVEAVPDLLPAAWDTTPLRLYSFLELTGVKSRRAPDLLLAEAVARRETLALAHHRAAVGLSPHAPYSTIPESLRQCAALARRHQLRLTTHVAESAEEYDMFRHARGPMHAWLARNERPMTDCGGVSPVQHLERTGLLGPMLLAVHVNYLDPGDAELLAQRQVAVVHCPRSHAYFGHRPFPLHSLHKAGVRLCLGTDSLATVIKPREEPLELDLFAEVRALAAEFPNLAPAQIFDMVTVNGAHALGWQGRVGTLRPGAEADAIALPYAGRIEAVLEAVVHHRGPVLASLIGGQWALPPSGQVFPLDCPMDRSAPRT